LAKDRPQNGGRLYDDFVSFDPTTPNIARMYDYILGGKDNLAVDREAVDRIVAHMPEVVQLTREYHAFVRRAARYLAVAGLRQFLVLGTHLPAQGNVHDVVREVSPDAKVVYADPDPVVATHARALVEEPGRVAFAQVDLLSPADLLATPEVRNLLDLAQPVGLLVGSILHYFQDADDPQGAVKILRDALVPGSYMVLAHGVETLGNEEAEQGVKKVFSETSAGGTKGRTPEEIRALFGDFELVEPGLVQVAEWRPEHEPLVGETPPPAYLLAGVGRKPIE
jgi:hypothetical protein